MNKILAVVVVALVACSSHQLPPPLPGGLVLYAQTVPTIRHAEWAPSVVDATHSAPTQYTVTVDNGTPIVLLATSCTATCSQPITLTGFGSHTVVVIAQNPSVSNDPTTMQGSPPASLTFTLNQAPATPTGMGVR